MDRTIRDFINIISEAGTYTGLDPVIRKRQGMGPATTAEIDAFIKANPNYGWVLDRNGNKTNMMSGAEQEMLKSARAEAAKLPAAPAPAATAPAPAAPAPAPAATAPAPAATAPAAPAPAPAPDAPAAATAPVAVATPVPSTTIQSTPLGAFTVDAPSIEKIRLSLSNVKKLTGLQEAILFKSAIGRALLLEADLDQLNKFWPSLVKWASNPANADFPEAKEIQRLREPITKWQASQQQSTVDGNSAAVRDRANAGAIPMRLNDVVIDPDPAKLTPEMIKELKAAMYVPPALKAAHEAALAMPAATAPAPAATAPAAVAEPASKAINIDVRGTQSAAMSKIDPANYPDERAYAQAVAAAGNTAGADALAKQGQAAGLTTAAAIPVPAPKVAAPVAAPAPAPAPAKAPYKGSIGAQEIQKLNPAIIDVNRIQVGQTLKMPNGQPDYVVKPGDTLDRIAKGVKPAQGAMSANVAPAGQPAATAANPALGTIQGATKAIPAVAPPAGNPGGVGKNATYTADEIAAAQEALKDPKLGASDRAFYTGMLANQPKAVKENTGYDEVERIVSLVHYR